MKRLNNYFATINYDKTAEILSLVLLIFSVILIYLFIFKWVNQNSVEARWFQEEWQYRKTITINSSQVPTSNLYDFPVYINLADLGSDFFSHVKTDGGDIVITTNDGTTKLERELVEIDTVNETGELWFRANTVNHSSDTKFYIYYGNSAAAETNSQEAWNSNYVMVKHFNEDPSIDSDGSCGGSTFETCDSTQYANDGDMAGAMLSGQSVSGKMGNALDFDGNNDAISVTNKTSLNISEKAISLSAWIRPGTATARTIFGKPHTSTHSDPYFKYALFYDGSSNARQIQFRIDSTIIRSGSGFTCPEDQWCNIVGVYTGTQMQVYVNGALAASTAKTTNIQTSDQDLKIGTTVVGTEAFEGEMDEVRINKNVLSASWIAAEYANQNSPSTFYSIGIEEPNSTNSWYNTAWAYRRKLTVTPKMAGNSDLENFQAFLDLSELGPGFFQTVNSDGSDIVVTSADGTTKLDRDLVSLDVNNGTGELWFKAPSLSGTYNTDFYIYYGNIAATETNTSGFWTDPFIVVQHMDDDPSGSAPQLLDSTSQGNHLTTAGSMTSGDLVTGKMGNAINFDGSDDSANRSSVTGYTTGDGLTVDVWVRPAVLDGSQDIILDGFNTEMRLELSANKMRVNIGSSSNWCVTNISGGDALILNNWHKLTLTYDTSTLKLFKDGEQIANVTLACANNFTGLTVARFYAGAFYYSGDVDRVAVAKEARSAAWIKAEYYNQLDSAAFFNISEEESLVEKSWYDDSWFYRKRIIIGPDMVGSTDLADFPVYVDLASLGSDFFNVVESDGSDIVITSADGSTKLSRELVDIDVGSETGELWFKAPIIYTGTYNEFFLYYGNPSATETNSTDVWDEEYVMVQHMNEDPSSAPPQLQDSTVNSNNGTSQGTMTDTDLIDAKLYKGINFDGIDDYFSVTDNPFDFTSSFTVSGWQYYTQNSNHNMIMGNLNYGGNTGWMLRTDRVADTNGWALFIGNSKYSASGGSMLLNQWVHITLVYDDAANTVSFYRNGLANGVVTGVTKLPVANTNNLELGKEPGNGSFEMTGSMDEMRVTTAVLSAAWVTTEFNNQNTPEDFYFIDDAQTVINCPIIDGSAADFDGVSNGVITIGANTTWRADLVNNGVLDCSGYDILVVSGTTLTLEPLDNGNISYADDLQLEVIADNFTVQSTAKIQSDSLGYPGGQTYGPRTDGWGPGFGEGSTTFFGAAGGSYGGLGSNGNGKVTNGLYGAVLRPTSLGSGGGAADCAGPARGRNGGGSLKLNASGTLTLNGTISANGEDAVAGASTNGCRSGGGSGGSVLLDVNTLAGSGSISAKGGTGGTNTDGNYIPVGAGGGGRISVHYNSSSFSGSLNVDGGQTPTTNIAENGTIVFFNKSNSELIVKDTQRWLPKSKTEFEDNFTDVENLTISGNSSYSQTNDDGNPSINLTAATATFTINDTDNLSSYEITSGDAKYLVVVNDNDTTNHTIWGYLGDNTFSTPNNTFLIHDDKDRTVRGWLGDTATFNTGSPASWTFDIYKVVELKLDSVYKDQWLSGYGWNMSLDSVIVEPGQYLSTNGLGYDGGISTSINGKGPGGGGGVTGAAQGGGGGAYGGNGAPGSNALGGVNYGSAEQPIDLGSGGGTGECLGVKSGLNGGGALKLVSNTLTVNGKITAHGADATNLTSGSCRGGGGAGGSIWIETNGLNGIGEVCANGGRGGYFDNPGRGGGGGGGRIKVEYNSGNQDIYFCVDGGVTYNATNGQVGTLIVNGVPTVSNLRQFQDDGTTSIPVGGLVSGIEVVFKLDASDGNLTDDLFGEVEIQETANNFTNTASLRSDLYNYAGSEIEIELSTDDAVNPNWWRSQWLNAVKLDIDNSASAEDLEDFPVLVVLNSSRVDYSSIEDTADDIRFIDSDHLTVLPHEVEIWNESGNSYIWVKVPHIPAGSTADHIWMYYNNSAAADSSDPEGVWSNKYHAVWHLNDTATGTNAVNDSTGNGYHLTDFNSPIKSQAGAIGTAYDFSGANRYLRNNITTPGVPMTLEYIANPSSSSPIGIFDSAPAIAQVFRNYNTGQIGWWDAGTFATLNYTASAWNHTGIVLNYNGNRSLTYYNNGSLINHGVGGTTNILAWSNFTLGNINTGGNGIYTGLLDEVRISSVARSADWLEASYKSNIDSLITYNTAITEPPVSPYEITTDSDYHWQARVCDIDLNCTDWVSFGNNPENAADFSSGTDNAAPAISSVSIDSDATAVNLTAGTTTNVVCFGTATDGDGYADITAVEAKFYRTTIGAGAADDINNHYTVNGDASCVPSSGSGNTEDYTCTLPVYYLADPTDAGSVNQADDWTCEMTPSDGEGVGTGASDTIEMNTLRALAVSDFINYGPLERDTDTGAVNQESIISNVGNAPIDLEISGEDMCTDYPTCAGSVLPVANQQYALAGFTYGSGIVLTTSPDTVDISIAKPTANPSNSTSSMFWGISIPIGQTKGDYEGVNIFTATQDT